MILLIALHSNSWKKNGPSLIIVEKEIESIAKLVLHSNDVLYIQLNDCLNPDVYLNFV